MSKPLPTNRHITYREEYRRCGRCSQCLAGSRGHGPYLYGYWRNPYTKKLESKYMGKVAKAVQA